MANIRKFLDISTGHLPPLMRERITQLTFLSNVGATQYGWFVYASEEPSKGDDDDEKPFAAIWEKIRAHARENGCDYVLLDCDAERDPALTYYGDSEHPE